MSPLEHLRHLLTPDKSRWQPMLAGLACFAAGAAAAVLLQSQQLVVAAALTLVALAAWLVGACAMVGYVRWLFASEVSRASRERRDRSS